VTPDPAHHPARVLRDDAERLRQTAGLHDAAGETEAAALARAKAAADELAADRLVEFDRGKWVRLR
jgi:hypothetical protein